MDFAILESRANQAAMRVLANADATVDGVALRGIFDNGSILSSVGPMGMAASAPSLSVPSASIPAQPVGLAVVVAGGAYTVANVDPDGSGISRLWLERVS